MPRTESSARPRGRREPSTSSRRSMPPTITMDHSDYGNVTYSADWRDAARLDSLHEVPNKGAAMKKTGTALAALLCFASVPPAALADPSFYLGYTGNNWS